MVIIDKRQNLNTVDFKILNFGDVFQDEDGDICVKIENDHPFANAVVLSTGCVFKCSSDTPVTPLIAELIITNNK